MKQKLAKPLCLRLFLFKRWQICHNETLGSDKANNGSLQKNKVKVCCLNK